MARTTGDFDDGSGMYRCLQPSSRNRFLALWAGRNGCSSHCCFWSCCSAAFKTLVTPKTYSSDETNKNYKNHVSRKTYSSDETNKNYKNHILPETYIPPQTYISSKIYSSQETNKNHKTHVSPKTYVSHETFVFFETKKWIV